MLLQWFRQRQTIKVEIIVDDGDPKKRLEGSGWEVLGANPLEADRRLTPAMPVTTARSLPLCQRPTWPKHKQGDPKQAASFACQK